MNRDDVRLAMAGDRVAFGRLVSEAHPAVAAITFAITRDRDASADATQDAFLAAWLGLRRLRNPDSFLAWLRQLARHVARSAVRTHARRARCQVTGELADALLAQVTAPSAPDAVLMVEERNAAVAAALDALPDDARDCVILFYYEEQSAERVAQLLGISPATVRKRLERARRRLRSDVMARLGKELRHSAPTTGATAAIVAALGSTPQGAYAATVAATAASVSMAAIGGAAIGAGWSIARIGGLTRQIGSRLAARRLAIAAGGAVGVFAVALPLVAPRLLWLWFILTQGGIAYVHFYWLPRHGVHRGRGDLTRWLFAAGAGSAAVVWALSRMS